MKISRQTIDTLLQQTDIEGLIQSGAPSDEYSSEAEIISTALNELNDDEINEGNIVAVVSEVWKTSFGLDSNGMQQREPVIRDLAKTFLKNLEAMF